MSDIARADRRLIAMSVMSPVRLLGLAVAAFLAYMLIGLGGDLSYIGYVVIGAAAGLFAVAARTDYIGRRFSNAEHRNLWSLIEDRMAKIKSAMKKLPPHIRASLAELETSVDRTADRLYYSLRRADIVKTEIAKSEGPLATSGMPFHIGTHDEETKELYVQADRNVAEYRRHFLGIYARVTRTEGQCAVFISALDSLRVQLLGHRLVGDREQVPANEFGDEMENVKSQLRSIDKALYELDLPMTPAVEEVQAESLGKIPNTPP
jgi:hypothetical protein